MIFSFRNITAKYYNLFVYVCVCVYSVLTLNRPFFNELTGDGPHTRARKDVSVKYTQLQVVFSLFQLFDHLMDKLEVILTIADEGIKGLRC